jgi:hypothetical protein
MYQTNFTWRNPSILLSVVLGIFGGYMLPVSAQTLPKGEAAVASDPVNAIGTPPPSAELVLSNAAMNQVTSVSQLSDVQPTDWAFQALQSLVERYGCIVGYPDKTYRGNRAMTRYEFAAGLNACMDRVNELVSAGTADLVKQEDFVTLKRMQEEFAAELATLRGRVDGLEARTATLEKQQFSTTTKLFGQVILGVQGRSGNRADFFPVDGVKDTDDPGTNTNVISNLQLSLYTQFSPRSVLLTGLSAGSGSTSPNLTNNVRLSYEGDTGNALQLSDLTYRQLFGNMVNVLRGANRVESAGSGPISAFAQRNPILNIGASGAGVGFDWQISPRASLQAVYYAANANLPNGQGGLFNGRTTIGAQLTLAPTNNVDIALNYVNAYSPGASPESGPGGFLRTGVGEDQLSGGDPLKTNAFGGTISWRISPQVTLGGWGGFTSSKIPGQSGRVETTNWMAFLNFPNLFGKGNMGGIYVGQPPKITSSDLALGQNIPDLLAGGLGAPGRQSDTTTHVEVFYRWRVTDNISITPGLIFVFNPANTSGSDTVTIGAVRTTFTF